MFLQTFSFLPFQTEDVDPTLAPQMGDGGFQFNPGNAGAASGPQDPSSMQGTPFQFWKNMKKITNRWRRRNKRNFTTTRKKKKYFYNYKKIVLWTIFVKIQSVSVRAMCCVLRITMKTMKRNLPFYLKEKYWATTIMMRCTKKKKLNNNKTFKRCRSLKKLSPVLEIIKICDARAYLFFTSPYCLHKKSKKSSIPQLEMICHSA